MALTKIDDRGLNTPIDLLDNEKIRFGTGNDFKLSHDGSNSYLENETGDIIIQNSGGNTSNQIYIRGKTGVDSIRADGNGSVYIYDQGTGSASKKFETTSTGAQVTGALKVKVDGEGYGDGLILEDTDSSSQSELTHVNGTLYITSDPPGATHVTLDSNGHLAIPRDNAKFKVGAGADLEIYHDGSDSYIDDAGTGSILIRSDTHVRINKQSAAESMATFTPDGAVELYYDAVKKFETTSNGITVTGAQNKFQTSGEVSLMIGSTDAGGAAIYFDGDSNGDWIGGDYSWIRHTTGGDMEICADNPSEDAGLYLKTKNGGTNSIYCQGGGKVELFHNGSSKFETLSVGAGVLGLFQAAAGGAGSSTSAIELQPYGDDAYLNATATGNWYFRKGASYTTEMTMASDGVISGDFNDTSDEKRKKNITSISDGAIANIKQLRPVNFNWKDPNKTANQSGFIAQEVKTVIPDLVVGEEYDENKDGIGYAINTSGVVAHLTKALQEAITKIETLETKVAALEAA